MKKLLIILILLIALGCAAYFMAGGSEVTGLVEKDPPIIEFQEVPEGLGRNPVNLQLTVRDAGAGLDEILIRIRKRGRPVEVHREDLGGRKEAKVEVNVKAMDLELREGKTELEIRVFDRSYWSNALEVTYPLVVDYSAPEVAPLTTQHNARFGGAQLVIYEVKERNEQIHGVSVAGELFFGFPASRLDPTFKGSQYKAALYAVPLGKPGLSRKKIVLFARDKAGNETAVPFYNKILKRKYENRYETMPSQQAERVDDAEEEGIRKNLLRQHMERMWVTPFARQPAAQRNSFGDWRVMKFNEEIVGRERLLALRMMLGKGKVVYAAQTGRVTFIEETKSYGNVIALDHGLGLVSLYGYLVDTKVSVGDKVKQGDLIGIGGGRGQIGKADFVYQLRLQGQPIEPREWWDRYWYKEHATGKINEAKRAVGLPVR